MVLRLRADKTCVGSPHTMISSINPLIYFFNKHFPYGTCLVKQMTRHRRGVPESHMSGPPLPRLVRVDTHTLQGPSSGQGSGDTSAKSWRKSRGPGQVRRWSLGLFSSAAALSHSGLSMSQETCIHDASRHHTTCRRAERVSITHGPICLSSAEGWIVATRWRV